MYDGRQLLCFSSIREKITFNENALLRDQRKKWVLLENQHYILNIEDIFTKFTGQICRKNRKMYKHMTNKPHATSTDVEKDEIAGCRT